MRRIPLLLVVLAATVGLAACGQDTTDLPDLTDPETASPDVPRTTDDRPVVVAFDGLVVPLGNVCAGADGAVRATTEDEGIVVTLVREDGVALRYDSADATTETDEVTVDESEDDTVYTATLSTDQRDELAVTMTVAADATAELPSCE